MFELNWKPNMLSHSGLFSVYCICCCCHHFRSFFHCKGDDLACPFFFFLFLLPALTCPWWGMMGNMRVGRKERCVARSLFSRGNSYPPHVAERGQVSAAAVDTIDVSANSNWTRKQELQLKEVVNWIWQWKNVVPSAPGKLPFNIFHFLELLGMNAMAAPAYDLQWSYLVDSILWSVDRSIKVMSSYLYWKRISRTLLLTFSLKRHHHCQRIGSFIVYFSFWT